jgi:hypothetical protein
VGPKPLEPLLELTQYTALERYAVGTKGKGKVFPVTGRWRPTGVREVEAPIFSDIWFTDGGQVVSPTRRPLFIPRKIPGTHFC